MHINAYKCLHAPSSFIDSEAHHDFLAEGSLRSIRSPTATHPPTRLVNAPVAKLHHLSESSSKAVVAGVSASARTVEANTSE